MSTAPYRSSQTWDADRYRTDGSFVAELASDVVSWLAPLPGEHILDVGCGTGTLTNQLAASGAVVTGCDADASMLAGARADGYRRVLADMRALPFLSEFDAIFSNAALHWVREQDAVLDGLHRALVSGGRFVAEMGGFGNIAAIRVALQGVLRRYGVDAETEAASYFPSASAYTQLLLHHGFTVERMALVPRPTPLKGGMDAWLRTFRSGVFSALPDDERETAIADTCALLAPVLTDADGSWWADYVRLRFVARRSS